MEFAALVKAMKAAQPQVILGGTYFNDAVAFVREAKRQQLDAKLLALSSGAGIDAFRDELGDDINGLLVSVQWIRSARVPGAQDFSFRYKRYFGYAADYTAAGGYGAGLVLEAAVRLAGTLDKDKVREELRALKFGSLFGRYGVDETGRQTAKDNYILQWQDGRRRMVLPEHWAEAPLEYPFKSWIER